MYIIRGGELGVLGAREHPLVVTTSHEFCHGPMAFRRYEIFLSIVGRYASTYKSRVFVKLYSIGSIIMQSIYK